MNHSDVRTGMNVFVIGRGSARRDYTWSQDALKASSLTGGPVPDIVASRDVVTTHWLTKWGYIGEHLATGQI